MSTDAARILAQGSTVSLGGQTCRLIFDVEALIHIEEVFDGLDPWESAMDAVFTKKPLGSKLFKAVKTGLEAGLLHRMSPDLAVDFVRQHFDVGELMTYRAAVSKGYAEAMPPPAAAGPKDDAADGSPGDASTGSQPSDFAAATASSTG